MEGRKERRREESEEDMKEKKRSVKESGKEDREGQGGQILRGGARKRWLGRTERGEAGEKLRRYPKVGMEAERRGERADREDDWHEVVVKARRRMEKRAERQERERKG